MSKAEADEKIENYIAKHELLDKLVVRANLLTSKILGNTKRCYDKHVNGLYQFCHLIMGWCSVIFFSSDFSTHHFPSMDAQTLALYFDFKHNELGSELIDLEGNLVKDCTGNPILCEWTWNDPGNRE